MYNTKRQKVNNIIGDGQNAFEYTCCAQLRMI